MDTPISYYHFRWESDKPSKCGRHIISNLGGTTYAFFYDPETEELLWAAAYCHPKDNYNKRLGREKARGRLDSPEYCHSYTGDIDGFFDEIERMEAMRQDTFNA